MVDHQQVVANVVEPVEVPTARRHFGSRPGRHLVIKYLVTQPLGGIDLGLGPGQPDPEIAKAQTGLIQFIRLCIGHAQIRAALVRAALVRFLSHVVPLSATRPSPWPKRRLRVRFSTRRAGVKRALAVPAELQREAW